MHTLWDEWVAPLLLGTGVGGFGALICTVCMWLTAPQLMGTPAWVLGAELVGGFGLAVGLLTVVWGHLLAGMG